MICNSIVNNRAAFVHNRNDKIMLHCRTISYILSYKINL